MTTKPNIHTVRFLKRNTVLRSAGITLALPFLDAMQPAFASKVHEPKAKRFVGLSLSLGLHQPNWIPESKGQNYKPSKYLKSLQDLRKQFTIISGTSHPGVTGGHSAVPYIFTGCPLSSKPNHNTISLDQLMAKHLGHETRHPYLVLNTGGELSTSYTEKGAMIPAMHNPLDIFKMLFITDTPKEQNRQLQLINRGHSILDMISSESKKLKNELGADDRHRLEEWQTHVRYVEKRLTAKQQWVHKPKPNVNYKAPTDSRYNVIEYHKTMLDMIGLALKTDLTRFITLHVSNIGYGRIDGVDEGYHGLSHHGRNPKKLSQLSIIEQALINNVGDFLRTLNQSHQKDKTLLDETMVLMTSNLGNGSTHDNKNMPVFFAGGGFKHGQHLAFSPSKNYPLSNLFLNALHQLGIPAKSFSKSKSEMSGMV